MIKFAKIIQVMEGIMKKKLLAAAIVLGLSLNSAFATQVAFIDVQKVVDSSAQVQALKKDREAQMKDIVSFIEKARKEVAAESDTDKKKALDEKYTKQLNAKREKMDKDYASKLKVIEESISTVVNHQAKLKGYDMVVSKGVVLYGTTDITEDVIKAVKAQDAAKKTPAKKK